MDAIKDLVVLILDNLMPVYLSHRIGKLEAEIEANRKQDANNEKVKLDREKLRKDKLALKKLEDYIRSRTQ